jgi:hypothetical protein
VARRDPEPTAGRTRRPTANPATLVKEQLVNPRIGWGQPPAGWGQPHQTGWAPLVDAGPAPLHAARSVGRWLWPTLALTGFLLVASFVVGHDDPAPGLSRRGLLTIALAALVVILLTIRRAAGPGPLTRALVEYTIVFLLAVLVATTGIDTGESPAADQASTTTDQRPALVKTIDGFRDWLGEWRQWAHTETNRRNRSASTTLDPSRPLAPSPTLPSSSTRSPL